MAQTYELRCGQLTVEDLTAASLRQLADADRIRDTDFVRKTGGSSWTRSNAVPGLAERLSGVKEPISRGEHERQVEAVLFEMGLSPAKSQTDEAICWSWNISDEILAGCTIVDTGFAVFCRVGVLSGRQLDDARLLERLLRVANSAPGATLAIDSDDTLVLKTVRMLEDLDPSEIRNSVLGVLSALEKVVSRVTHLLT